MPRRKSKDESLIGAMAALVMMLLFIIWFTPSLGAKVGYSLLLSTIVGGLVALKLVPNWLERKRFAALTIDEVDTMEGHKFERYIATLLEYQGYITRVTPRSGDLGIDVVAKKGTERIAIQCKRYSKAVPRTAISDAVAGMQHYQCNIAMVVTTNYFTDGAKQLARSTNCRLVDRRMLAEWVNARHQDANKQASQI